MLDLQQQDYKRSPFRRGKSHRSNRRDKPVIIFSVGENLAGLYIKEPIALVRTISEAALLTNASISSVFCHCQQRIVNLNKTNKSKRNKYVYRYEADYAKLAYLIRSGTREGYLETVEPIIQELNQYYRVPDSILNYQKPVLPKEM